MTLTVRRRAAIAVLVTWPIGWLALDVGWRLGFHLLQLLRNPSGYVSCTGGGLPRLVEQFNGCDTGDYRWAFALVEVALLVAGAAVVALLLARWVAAPLGDVARTLAGFGPNSLGLRLRPQGPRDETRRLAEAVDSMLDRLAEGYEAQRRFASNASHELRTPLATQRALIEVSLSSALTDDQLALLSRQLLATNERNERLVDGLLTLAETDRGLVTTTRVRLDGVTAAVVESLRPAADERGLALHLTTAPTSVVGEVPLLERLVANLVQNAVKYNVPGGRIDVDVRQDGVLTVANTGPVVPGDQVAALFEPFRRLAGERLDHAGGVGLGLTIARSIVAAHRGGIHAVANPGGGLTVEVRLPTVA